jgi:hypothetical protein
MELKRYLRVVASTGDDDDDYSMVEISNRRAREAADRIEKLEAALRTVKEWHGYGLPPETTRIIDAALEGKDG